jgi:bifunctional DNase/RNase
LVFDCQLNFNLLICNHSRYPLKKIELRIVGLSYSQAQANSYALVLGELDGKRRLPIVIGHYEAQAIALEIEKMRPSRPLTHDLFFNFAKIFGINLIEVEITKFHEGIFHSTLICDNGVSMREIDSRTSDAVALAIRFKCPIYTSEQVLDQAGIMFEEEEPQIGGTDNRSEETVPFPLRNLSIAELEADLQQAIEDEDYEKASLIRDEIKRRE